MTAETAETPATEATAAAETPAEATPTAAGTPTPEAEEEGTEAPDNGRRRDPGREAAKYRERAKAAETERDTLRDRLNAAHKREVEGQARASLADPSDLWSSVELSDLLGEDGEVDPEAVRGAVDTLVQSKPHYASKPKAPKPDPSQGARGPAVGRRMGDIFKQK